MLNSDNEVNDFEPRSFCFKHSSDRGKGFQKRSINMVNFFDWTGILFVFMCAWVCVLLNVSIYVCVYAVAHTYIDTYICAYNGIDIYIYTHICAVCCWEGVKQRKRAWEEKSGWEGRVRKELLPSEWFLFLLVQPNFPIAKSLFDVNTKCLFCGEFYWVIMMVKIKNHHHIYNTAALGPPLTH